MLGFSLVPTADLGRAKEVKKGADYNFRMFQDGDGTVTVDGTDS